MNLRICLFISALVAAHGGCAATPSSGSGDGASESAGGDPSVTTEPLCKVNEQADGSKLITCDDGTEAVVRDGMDGVDGKQGPAGPPGPTGDPGPEGQDGTSIATCKWCRSGEQTIQYVTPGNVYMTYQCSNVDADDCGTWSVAQTCNPGESVHYVYADEDQHGLPSRFTSDLSIDCFDPLTQQPNDECIVAKDCGDASKDCMLVDGAHVCTPRATWMNGTGTWDYMTDHFSWNIWGLWFPATPTCEWGRNTYWHTTAAKCSLTIYAKFDAPQGGMDYVTLSMTQIDAATPLNTNITGKLSLTINATAAAHTGAVSLSLNNVVFTSLDFRSGGSATGTWQFQGTVGGANNVVGASGSFHIAFP